MPGWSACDWDGENRPGLRPTAQDADLAPVDTQEVVDARSRSRGGLSRLEHRIALATALPLLAIAAVLPLLARGDRPIDVPLVIACVLALAVLSTIELEVASGSVVPTQVAFVPLIFAVPPGLIPALTIAAYLAGTLLASGRSARALLLSIGSCWFAIGPTALLLVTGDASGARMIVVGLVALLAQTVFDIANWVIGARAAGEQLPRLRQVAWVYSLDASLTPLALAGAVAGGVVRFASLLPVAVVGVLLMFRAERTGRITSLASLSSAYRGTALLLGQMIEADDQYTGEHSAGVVGLSRDVAEAVGLPQTEMQRLEFAALLHDVGKTRIPKAILHKPGPLTPDEWAVMRLHPQIGADMLTVCGGELADVAPIVRHHHERFDGGGYPDGLAGNGIPLAARVLAVCDAFSAMTTDRPYRAAMTPEAAADELRRVSGTQFDPDVVDVFLGMLDAGEPPVEQAA
jgi:HD-GYP domain-containing protein (c-di-GMP phosphodiesterase class II)